MPKPRGRSHTTLTETSEKIVSVLEKMSGIKMIAPGKISTASKSRSGQRHCTIVYITAGFELIISGQGVQNVAVHLVDIANTSAITQALKNHKSLTAFAWRERHSKLGL